MVKTRLKLEDFMLDDKQITMKKKTTLKLEIFEVDIFRRLSNISRIFN
jgi:hypothetical protein